jgi:hypothetical protein
MPTNLSMRAYFAFGIAIAATLAVFAHHAIYY